MTIKNYRKILSAVVALSFLVPLLSTSNAVAQISFGKMRDAAEKGKKAPELPEDEIDVADATAPQKTQTSEKTGESAPSAQKNAATTPAASTSRKPNASRLAPKTDAPQPGAATSADSLQNTDGANAFQSTRTAPKPAVKTTTGTKEAVAVKAIGENGRGPRLGRAVSHKYRAGMIFRASIGGTCSNVFGSAPVPMEFPEQKVRTLEENFPPVAKVSYRELKEGGARQMVFKMRELREGQGVEASSLFEVTRYPILPPEDPTLYSIPKSVSSELRRYLKEGKYMESNTKLIRTLAKETTENADSAWEKVDAILTYVRDTVQYKETLIDKTMRGALAAYRSREGDCEDMSALFIAMCRALEIPARLVRVPGHCWAEFYLVDDEKNGYWFPAQVAGTEELGSMQDTRVILQKGDSFRLPESPKEEELYVKELFMGVVKEGGPDPQYQFIQETDGR